MDATTNPPTGMPDLTTNTSAGGGGGGGRVAATKPREATSPNHTVHLVGQLTDVVFSFLGPATAALAEVGHHQTVVVMEDPRFAYLPGEFSPSVDLIVIKHDTRSRRWREALPLFWRVLRQHQPSAVHFHGFIPLTIGTLVVRLAAQKPVMYYSPHGSKAHGRFNRMARLVIASTGRALGIRRLSTIVTAEGDTDLSLSKYAQTANITNPVATAFLLVKRSESTSPLILAGHRASSPEAAFELAQMSAIFSGTQESISFAWLGKIDDQAAAAALRAAGVKIIADDQTQRRAEALAKGWLYLAPKDARGFAVHVAEAMAAGVPCVASNIPSHRALIEPGATGYLYEDNTEAIQIIAKLIDNHQLRQEIGSAGRYSTQKRQLLTQFIKSLESIYQGR